MTQILEKTCRACGLTKSVQEFWVDRSRMDGYGRLCSQCAAQKNKQYYSENRERMIALASKYTRKHDAKVKARHKAMRDAERVKAIEVFGGSCYCCGETNLKFLTLDHVNNDGWKHRRQFSGGTRGGDLYSWLRRRNYQTDFELQVACWNCNCGKGRNKGICPHEEERSTELRAIA